MMQIYGRRYENGEPIRVTVADGKIRAVDAVVPNGDAHTWPWIAPGLFDLQINGHAGIWFSKEDLTADEVIQTLEPHFRFGITRMCPTLITNSFEALASGFRAINEACERETWVSEMVPGCHLEGPYISRDDGPRGAHPLEHVRAADWEEFSRLQDISGNRICLVTLAAEAENAVEFIRKATASGVVVSIGHTAATPEQITAAVDAGATFSTHLGNGAHGTIRRHPNYIWEQLGDNRLWAGLITDGYHLPASVVRSIVQTKGINRVVVTCDASGLAGCPPGIYTEGNVDVEILADNRIVIAGQTQLLAGSGVETDTCITKVREFTGLSLHDAWDLASRNPALLLGFEEIRLRRGSRADLVLFHHDTPGEPLEIQATTMAGTIRYQAVDAQDGVIED